MLLHRRIAAAGGRRYDHEAFGHQDRGGLHGLCERRAMAQRSHVGVGHHLFRLPGAGSHALRAAGRHMHVAACVERHEDGRSGSGVQRNVDFHKLLCHGVGPRDIDLCVEPVGHLVAIDRNAAGPVDVLVESERITGAAVERPEVSLPVMIEAKAEQAGEVAGVQIRVAVDVIDYNSPGFAAVDEKRPLAACRPCRSRLCKFAARLPAPGAARCQSPAAGGIDCD